MKKRRQTEDRTPPLVAFAETPHPDAIGLLRQHCRIAFLGREPGRPGSGNLPEAAAWLAFMSDRIGACFLDRCPRLRVVAGALRGTDNIDVPACTARDVWVTAVDDLLSAPTAELAVGLLLAAARRLREGDALVRGDRFEGWRRGLDGFTLERATVGVIGAGSLGRAILKKLTGLGARCVFRDPAIDGVDGALPMPLDQLLARCQAVVLALPLEARTCGFLDADRISKMRQGAVLVNVGRGSTVEEAAIAEALGTGRLAAYAADVFAMEDRGVPGRPRRIHPGLLSHPRSIYTPHLGTACVEARREIELAAARGILQVLLEDRRPDGAVNDLSVDGTMGPGVGTNV